MELTADVVLLTGGPTGGVGLDGVATLGGGSTGEVAGTGGCASLFDVEGIAGDTPIGTDCIGLGCTEFSDACLFASGSLAVDDEVSGLGRFKALRRSRARCFLSACRGVRIGEIFALEVPAVEGGGQLTIVEGGVVDWPMLPVEGGKGGTSGGSDGWLLCAEGS